MSFLTATNTELLYSMPAKGANVTGTALTNVSGNTTTNPAYQLPALQNIWPISSMVGKGLRFVAAGCYDATAVANTLGIYLDTTENTQVAGNVVAATGAATWASTTVGSWYLDVTMTCTGTGTGANAALFYATGYLALGVGNNAATSTAATVYMTGGANALGVPTSVGGGLNPTVSYFPEIWTTWGTAPTAFCCSQYLIFGLN